jgi:hypothetical protein
MATKLSDANSCSPGGNTVAGLISASRGAAEAVSSAPQARDIVLVANGGGVMNGVTYGPCKFMTRKHSRDGASK